jgi:ketosteroid isomerase-like protein
MTTAAQQLAQHRHVETIRRYYAACNSRDVDGVAACCTPDVVHYFLRRGEKPVQGNEHLGRHWRSAVEVFASEWKVEHAVACDDEAVIEWSMRWTSPENGGRYICHGAEWYTFREGLISEIRAYYDFGRAGDTGLVGFPYAERGYTIVEPSSAPTACCRER